MAYTGTDFAAYTHFQNQAEDYRYKLAQAMNTLQKDYISNKKPLNTDKPYTVSHTHWAAFPDFDYRFLEIKTVLKTSAISLAAIVIWLFLSVLFISLVSKKAKAI
jgi:ABC-2 type transport system permease protein